MVFTQQVFEADPKGEVCIGQVKGDSFNANFVSEFVDPVGSAIDYSSVSLNSTLMASCLIVVELIYNAKSKEVTAHFRDSACNSKSVSVGQFSLGETIKMSFAVNGYNVVVSSNKVTLPAYSYSFWKGANYQMHFKVGTYVQGTGADHSKGGKSKLSALSVTHG